MHECEIAMEATILLQVLNLLALLLLVGLTAWYARSTSKTVKELQRQVDSSSRQSEIIAKSAQVSAYAALTRAKSNPPEQSPYVHLRRLVKELEEYGTDLNDADEHPEEKA